jgi:TRAP transporter 4TM/12TM fusion protein
MATLKRAYECSKITLPLSALFSGFIVYRYLNWNIFSAQPLALTLTLTLLYLFLPSPGTSRHQIVPYFLAFLCLISGLYLVVFYKDIFDNAGNPSVLTIILGSVMVLLILDAVRRLYGAFLTIIIGAFIIYPFLGPYLFGPFRTRHFMYNRVVEAFYYQPDGLLGLPLDICVSIVTIFILMGICFMLSGASNYLSNLFLSVMGRSRGGPAKVSVFCSSALGTITGSAAANASTIGVLTIPLMKKVGYPPHIAAAVEAVASTGGVITPPVMGAAAFLMAEYLDVPYFKIMLAAAVPAFMYYLGVYLQVHFAAIRYNLSGISDEDIPRARDNLRVLYLIGIPIGLLVLCLAVFQQRPAMAGGVAILSLILVSLPSRKTRLTPGKVFAALKQSVDPIIQLVVISAAAGLVVGSMMLTNLGTTITRTAFAVTGDSSFLALILVAISAIILGMGMPATPVYIILVFAAVPALLHMGINPLCAHLFVFYFGIMSFITPPICVAVYVTSAIANSSPMKTALSALKLGSIGYLFPFLMVYFPQLLLTNGNLASQTIGLALSIIFVVGTSIFLAGPVFRIPTRGVALLAAIATVVLLKHLF